MHQPSLAQFAGAVRIARAAPSKSSYPRVAAVLRALLKILALPEQLIAIRRDLAQLGSMDDRELSDIGLCRQDLRDATALPWHEHPGRFFNERSVTGRVHRSRHRLR